VTVNRGVVCERLTADGRGVAEVDGIAVSAADWLPGEVADLAIEHTSPHRALAWARVVERRGPPAADRVEPSCPGFGSCGGCRLQHASAAVQLELKRRRVVDALAAAGLGAVEVAAPVPSPSPFGYRSKGKYVFGTGRSGELVVGAYRPRSHRVVSTLGCQVVDPAIDALAVAMSAAVTASGIAIYDEATRTGELRYAIIRSGADAALAVCLITRSAAARPAIESIAAALIEGGAAGVAWGKNDRDDGALLVSGSPPEPITGDLQVLERSAGVELRLPVTAFAQINRGQAGRLIDRLVDRLDLESGARVLDAYAGAGVIAIALAARGASVTAIEIDAAAVAAGRAAIAAAGVDVALEIGDAADRLGDRFDAVVINPPRKGLDRRARSALARSGAARIAYVSCGPESLARDLAALAGAGYAIDRVEPFDLMPGTPEIETLTLCFKG
jgi:23S rRNA (uracil1939-C5)-methyltransferase